MPSRRGFIGLGAAWALSARAAGDPALVVGPPGRGPGFAEVLREARDGDTIAVLPGTYRGEVATITQRRLNIRGIGERPVFDADGRHAEGKAIWVVRDGEVTVANIEFRGARVPATNGAGIRFERGRLRLLRCAFLDNEMGLLTANFDDAEIDLVDCEFGAAPHTPGSLHHLLYIGRIARASITGSRFHGGYIGHLVKCRAGRSVIANNLIFDGPAGSASYQIDLPNGGDALVLGNVIGQSAATQNPALVSYGAEGNPWPRSRLALAHNTLLSDLPQGTRYLHVHPDRLPPEAVAHLVNNLSVDLAIAATGLPGEVRGNAVVPRGALIDPDMLAFGLRRGAPARGRGVDPRHVDGLDLAPKAEFTLPVGTRPLAVPVPARWTPGAFQR